MTLPRVLKRAAPWAPAKRYETVFSMAGRDQLLERAEARGISPWWRPREDATEQERQEQAAFIERIQGSYSGVMGLPLYETARLLQAQGLYGALAPS